MSTSAGVGLREGAGKAGFSSSIFTANPVNAKVQEVAVKEVAAVPVPVKAMHVFSDSNFPGLGIHSVLAAHLEKLKIVVPTEIQKVSIPKLLSVQDRDVIVQAQTVSCRISANFSGFWKDLFILAPNLESLDDRRSRDGGKDGI